MYKNNLIPFFKVQDLSNYNFNTKTKFGISNKDVLMNKYKVFTKESICFAKVGEACKLNRKIKIKEKEYLVDNNLSLLFLLGEKNNINFLFFLCLKINFNKFINNGSLPSISLSDLLSFSISLPSLPEQQKIAHFFSLLDKQIQLWERKLELYELKKKYYLNILLDTINNFPKLRFKEFESERIFIKKFKDISKIYGTGVDKNINNYEKKGKIINFMDVYKNVYLNDEYNFNEVSFTEEEYKKYRVYKGDILITPSSEDKINIGLASLININNTELLVYSYHLNLIRLNIDCYPLYISYQLRTQRVKKYFYRVSQGVSRYTLSIADIQNLSIYLPPFKEQEKIAHFIWLIDKQIENFIYLKEQIKKMKKFYINNIFI